LLLIAYKQLKKEKQAGNNQKENKFTEVSNRDIQLNISEVIDFVF